MQPPPRVGFPTPRRGDKKLNWRPVLSAFEMMADEGGKRRSFVASSLRILSSRGMRLALEEGTYGQTQAGQKRAAVQLIDGR